MISVLSPLAPPFHPMFEPINIAIYNDGIPSLTVFGIQAEVDILHGIQDEAIDEQFPPSAEDAAEIEAAEKFVETMAALALLEELEEKARMTFCHIKKRWEARRAEGLHGKPHQARHGVSPVDHSKAGVRKQMLDSSIVPYRNAHYLLVLSALEQRERAKEAARRSGSRAGGMKSMHDPKPIQQPRKNH